MFYEKIKDFDKAKKYIKKAMRETLNSGQFNYYKEEKKRLKEKLK